MDRLLSEQDRQDIALRSHLGYTTIEDAIESAAKAQDAKTCKWWLAQLEKMADECGNLNCNFKVFCRMMKNDCELRKRIRKEMGL